MWQRLLKLGRSLYQAWLDLFGDGDAGDRIVLEDGREVGRLENLHRREIQNLFGVFKLMRAVYGTHEGQKIEAVPLDERLQLPQGKSSYLLQDWDQALAVELPFETVSATLARILGFSQSVHIPRSSICCTPWTSFGKPHICFTTKAATPPVTSSKHKCDASSTARSAP